MRCAARSASAIRTAAACSRSSCRGRRKSRNDRWQVDGERAAAALLRGDADPAVVLAREARRHRQADPGALGLLRREERLEDVAEIAVADPGAGVLDVDADVLAVGSPLPCRWLHALALDTERDRA